MSSRIRPSDTLVVSGFWRSGTTWLQESLAALLKAKTIFEPLFFRVPSMRQIYATYGLSTRSAEFLELHMPYCPDQTLGEPLRSFFDNALRGAIPGVLVRVLRPGITSSLLRRIVLKCVRSQLCLRALQSTFSMPIIHIYRDPRAIVVSIRNTDWEWLFDHLSLREQLLEPGDGRAEFFNTWRGEILDFDGRGRTARITAYWALTEIFVQQSFKESDARFVFVRYEDLCWKGEQLLVGILTRLGIDHTLGNVHLLTEGSYSTPRQRKGASIEERVSGWKNDLSSAEVTMIESIVAQFGLEDRLVANNGTG